jgi:NAD(P)-dependent dehydrogenase (short-subunit alcohol dehydrogenase family)
MQNGTSSTSTLSRTDANLPVARSGQGTNNETSENGVAEQSNQITYDQNHPLCSNQLSNMSDRQQNSNSATSQQQQPQHTDEDLLSKVPQLESHGITYGDLQISIKVLNAIASLNPKNRGKILNSQLSNDPSLSKTENQQATSTTHISSIDDGIALYKQSNLRPFRKALSLCMDLHQRTMYQGQNESDHFDSRKQERSLKRQKMSEKDLYRKHIETTMLRKGRVDKLQAALTDCEEEERLKIQSMLIPDGHVDVQPLPLTAATTTTTTSSLCILNEENLNQALLQSTVVLPCLRSCYVCKIRYRDLHQFYDQLCPQCATINWEKRFQSISLDNRVAVVTGSRVKIGYQTCLKLLRAGCTVVATTRFPNAAIDTYRKEPDFDSWKHLLHVYGLDLRDVVGIELFTRYLKQQFGATTGIDILINNACQTIRRPCGYYAPAVQKEQEIWENADTVHKSLLSSCIEFEKLRRQVVVSDQNLEQHAGSKAIDQQGNSTLIPHSHDNASALSVHSGCSNNAAIVSTGSTYGGETNKSVVSAPFETTGISHSAAMSQMIILPEDVGVDENILPRGLSDINGQQLDLRTTNSWLLRMEQVSTPELMECMFINAIAPFVLNSRLKPLMAHPNSDDRSDRYIINVSAMEGKVSG